MIVVKASIKLQWPDEIQKFSDYTAGIVNTYASSTAYKRKSNKYTNKQINDIFKEQFNYDLLVLNYETLNDDKVIKQLKKENIEFMYVDEIHVIKSVKAKRSRSLYKMNYVPYKFGATATPIQKDPLDIYSIYKFLKPGLFSNISDFKSMYIKYNYYGFPVGSINEKILHRKIKPYMSIKSQDEVSKELPELVIIPKYCELYPKQLEVSNKLIEEIQEFKNQEYEIVKKYGSPEAARDKDENIGKLDGNIMARQTFAQEIADTEELLDASDSNLAHAYLTGCESNKIKLFLDLLDEIFQANEKVCVFSKYKRIQPILDSYINNKFKDIEIAHISSDYTNELRYQEVKRFKENNNCKIILLSDAGAEGINLESCQYLIEFEPADSFLIQTQRRGRIVRASSTHSTVYVYQLIAKESYDEIALKIVKKKKTFSDTIVENQEKIKQ